MDIPYYEIGILLLGKLLGDFYKLVKSRLFPVEKSVKRLKRLNRKANPYTRYKHRKQLEELMEGAAELFGGENKDDVE